ncbi:MAG: tRNA lysidine(34) synthetase TilS [Oscillospiraceae bacterium]|nr:tRNA lysidine(34) synthetase TilS [Oscillospiraceae bacterium]
MTITEAAEKYNMLSPGDRVLVALSGGADSMCLLHCLWENADKLGITVCAAHYNHGIRGSEAERDAEFAGSRCSERGIPFICGSGDVPKYAEEKRLSAEEAARELRYAFLADAAERLGCNKIATAHNAEDNAETLLLNLCRGGGARGLSGIPPVRGKIIRPLIMTGRRDIEAYLEEKGVPHVEDSTNLGDDYTRNIIRHRVMPVLTEINPAFAMAAMRTSRSLREDEDCLEKLAADFISENLRGNSLPADRLRALPGAVAVRVFRAMCPNTLTSRHAELLLGLLEGTELAYADITGMRVSRDGGRIIFGVSDTRLPERELPPVGELAIPEAELLIKTYIIENCPSIMKTVNKFDFKYSSLCGKMTVASRSEGDRFRAAGRGCTKSLKELFSEKKLTQSQRALTPVFRDGEGIIAVYGFGVAERCLPRAGDTVLRVEIIKRELSGYNYGNDA